MTSPDELGISPEVLARLERTYRTVAPIIEQAQPMIAMMERVAPTMKLIQSATSILGRQHAAMAYIQRSDETALRLQPASRQELAAIVRWLQAMPVTSGPAVSERDAELAILELTPEEPEDIRQVELTVQEIGQNSQFKRALQLLAQRSLTAAGMVTPWAALVIAARWLIGYANSPVTQDLSTAQITTVSSQLVVLGIIIALATLIITVDLGRSE
jgi:hypothetical protein